MRDTLSPTLDLEHAARRRLLKGASLLVTVAALLFVPVSLLDANNSPWFTAGVALLAALFAGIFGLAHYGYIRIGGLLMCAAQLIFNTAAAKPEDLLAGTGSMLYFIPILIAGMVLGSTAALICGLIVGGIILLLPQLRDVPWVPAAWTTFFVMLVVAGLLWLIISSLERLLALSHKQTTAALKAQEDLSSREQTLLDTNQQLQSSNNQMQSLLSLVRELETPVIPLFEGVLIVPLVGHLDSRRLQHLTQTVLDAVHQRGARTVILDITGVSLIDTGTVNELMKMTQAIKLLGTQVMLAGITAPVAQSIISLGVSFKGIQTVGQLQDGVAMVLSKVIHNN